MKARLLLAALLLAASSGASATMLLTGSGGATGAAPTCALNFDFTTAGGTLPGGVTMTGAANAWHYGSTGALVKSGVDVARFDYNPTTLALRGLLVEPAKTNALIHGGPDGWTFNNATLGTGMTDPAGGTNAIKITENASGTVEHHASLNIASWPVTSQAVTFSFFFRNNSGARFLQADFANSASFTGFVQTGGDPNTGTVNYGPVIGGNWTTPTGGTIQAINIASNQWYRFSFGATVSTAGTLQPDMVLTSDSAGTVFSYLGNGTSGIQLYGFMASKNSERTIADSFIDTRGSAVAVSTTTDTVTFANPACSQLTFTFDDNSTQLITGVAAGTYTIPTNLNRPWIKTIVGAP